jgi:ferredoxin
LEHDRLGELLLALQQRGYKVIGPRIREGAILYDTLERVEQLPQGWTDRHEAGHYRLERRKDNAYFGYNLGPQSWKKYLLPAKRRLWSVHKTEEGMSLAYDPYPEEPLAFFGVRACELKAIHTQDRVLKDSSFHDPYYTDRREDVFLIAAQCTQAGATCFCVSMDAGPRASEGFDIGLTEVIEDQAAWFLLEAASDKGREVLESLALREAKSIEEAAARQRSEEAAAQMGRVLDTKGLPALLDAMREDSYWKEIADRCLSCANCTMVCPTCFCTTVEDHTQLGAEHAERWRQWDSCFHEDFSYIVGGAIRSSTTSRYRQWMTHKLSSWVEQFGEMGCVGCGRCIAWCPVGIDITAEAKVFQEKETAKKAQEVAAQKKTAHHEGQELLAIQGKEDLFQPPEEIEQRAVQEAPQRTYPHENVEKKAVISSSEQQKQHEDAEQIAITEESAKTLLGEK